ncbi:PREDICTED: uncharacterized protein LOC109488060 [Branchiostoma belcheri]|uniref:Uncharacterized protein LOC109488060 n=1 Tax=Branchiostoma belcheri TaxID=7741 RepID=A0A6P5ADG9_BRABE|nr:PREDICTED: uncharacterized protein LOC109488060 [Branchiostoma belcheri]
MDSRFGACWRCGRPGGTKCAACELALYCSSACQERDKIRHEVECTNCAIKHTCSVCSTVAGDTKTCANCERIWYCNATCQRADWSRHKQSCNETREKIVNVARVLQRVFGQVQNMSSFPYYWGNSHAQDLIKIDQNEGEYPDKMAILLAGVGNLRNVMTTVAGLKPSFEGSIHFVLNDSNSQVLARNVLFLHILWKYQGEEKVAKNLTQIWYSVKITEEEATMAQECLAELLSLPDDTNTLCGGRVTISAEHWVKIRPVFHLWLSLLTGERNMQKSPQEQLQLTYEMAREGVRLYLRNIPRRHRESAENWFKTGILLSKSDPRRKRACRDNATLAAWNPAHDAVLRTDQRLPAVAQHVGEIAAGINDDAMPFSDWDYLEVKAQNPGKDLMKMYSHYIDDVERKFAGLFNQGRVSCHVILDDCLNVQGHLPVEVQFDRIFTSNISDYINYPVLLEKLRPLLRKDNPKSVIITEFINWSMYFPGEVTPPQHDPPLTMQLFSSAVEDLRHEPDRPDWVSGRADMMTILLGTGLASAADYFDNWGVFKHYLRAALLAHKCPESSYTVLSPKDVPKMSEVRSVSGMKMRNFLKELNTVCPFRNRVNVRRVTKLHGHRSVLEWTLPESV